MFLVCSTIGDCGNMLVDFGVCALVLHLCNEI